jgi:hypothetical protein
MSIETIRNHALNFNILITDYELEDSLLEKENFLLRMSSELIQLHLAVEDTAGENYAEQQTIDGQHPG